MTNNELPVSQLTDTVAEKQEVKCGVIENETPTGSRSTADVREVAEAPADVASTEVKMAKSTDDTERGTKTNEAFDDLAPSTLTEQETAELKQSLQMTVNSYDRPQEEELQDQISTISPGQMQQIVNLCLEGEAEAEMSTGTTSLEGFDAADYDGNGDSLCTVTSDTVSPPNLQLETPTQVDSATGEPMMSSEPEVAINSDELLLVSSETQQEAAAITEKEQISTPSTPENDNKQPEMTDQFDSHSEHHSSMSEQFVRDQDATTAPASYTSDGGSTDANETSKDQPSDAVEQSVQSPLDETSISSQPQNIGGESTSTTPSGSKLDSCSEDATASAAAEKATYVEQEQFRAAATDSASQDQPDEPSTLPLSEQELRSSVQPANAAGVPDMVRAGVEPVFTFPEPPRQPYEPVTVGDDSTDDVFVEHSSPRNDATDSREISASLGAVTSRTTIAAAADADVSRQQQARAGDERAPGSRQQQPGVPEALPGQVLAGPGCVVPPTSEPAAAAAAASAAGDGRAPAENWGDEVGADEPNLVHKLDASSSSSEPFPSSGDLTVQSTDAVRQQLDQLTRQQWGVQLSSGTADRQQLSLLIPAHDSDAYTSDNQVGVYLYTLLCR